MEGLELIAHVRQMLPETRPTPLGQLRSYSQDLVAQVWSLDLRVVDNRGSV